MSGEGTYMKWKEETVSNLQSRSKQQGVSNQFSSIREEEKENQIISWPWLSVVTQISGLWMLWMNLL